MSTKPGGGGGIYRKSLFVNRSLAVCSICGKEDLAGAFVMLTPVTKKQNGLYGNGQGFPSKKPPVGCFIRGIPSLAPRNTVVHVAKGCQDFRLLPTKRVFPY